MSIERLLKPRSVAIVGASDKIGPGFNAWNALKAVGFEGAIHLVNPRATRLLDQPCHPSLAAIPGPIDAVFVAVQAERVAEVVAEAAARGAGGLAILSSGFSEMGEEGKARQHDLKTLVDRHGMAACGPNCLGLLNFADRTALFGTSLPNEIPRGHVAVVAQSGSIGIALLNAARGLGLSHMITSGNEAVTTAADYLDWLVDQESARVLVVFLEQLRDAKRFMEVCRRAKRAGKPVIVLKSGRSQRGQAAVKAHTGALAGSVEVTDAALAEIGAIQVFSLDELVETAVLFSMQPKAPKSTGAAMLSLSGGQIALALDAAEAAGLPLAAPEEARAKLNALMPKGCHIDNPLDLSWAGLYDPNIAKGCAEALGRQSGIGVLALLQDAPAGLGTQQVNRYANLLSHVADGAAAAGVPLIAISNISGDVHPAYRGMAESKGVASLRGTHEGISALARYLAWWGRPAAESMVAGDPGARKEAASGLARADALTVLDEHTAKAVLAPYGLPSLGERIAMTPEEAVAAAEAIGFPVVLKALIPEVAHKSELGLVRLRLGDAGAVRRAATELLTCARSQARGAEARLLLQEMVTPVAELIVGARIDPDFGPVVVAGTGGVDVELYRDVAIALAPVSEAKAHELIQRTRAGRLLSGWRGKPKGDLAAAAKAIAAVSRFMADFADTIAEVEINPLAILAEGQGCRPLDCVIARRAPVSGASPSRR